MNSLRIGIVGILVNHWGPQDADGFLHMFEGWIIFIACAVVLVAEMTLLARLVNGKRFFEVFYPPKISAPSPQQSSTQAFNQMPLLSCLFLLCAVGAASLLVSTRQEIQPERTTFAAFPNQIGEWRGRPGSAWLGRRTWPRTDRLYLVRLRAARWTSGQFVYRLLRITTERSFAAFAERLYPRQWLANNPIRADALH